MSKSKYRRARKRDDPTKSYPGDEDPKFRLRPTSPRAGARGDLGWSIALRTIFRYAKTSVKRRKASRHESGRFGLRRSFNQRCAVRVTYSPNKTTGQWRAHGIYIARESAAGRQEVNAGFSADKSETSIASTLDRWQREGDERLWKVILSPEFGDRVDLGEMTREVVRRAERELDTPLEWIAVTHFNTEHPHVHLGIRGRRHDGRPLHLPREFIKHGLRNLAAEACTLQLGPRTELDAAVARERETRERRYTSLDRALERRIARVAGDEDTHVAMLNLSLSPEKHPTTNNERQLQARLIVLQAMGLAKQQSQSQWLVRQDFSNVLRAMQLAADRQKMLAANGSLLSDPRLRLQVFDPRKTLDVQGRILVHGEEEQGARMGRHYLLLEGTDAQVHMIFYTPELEAARSAGRLRVNGFVQLRRKELFNHPYYEVQHLGDAEAVLKNKRFLTSTAKALIHQGVIPSEEGWSGWLGKYQAAVCDAANTLELENDVSRGR